MNYCNKCKGKIITNPGEHPQCLMCGWIDYSTQPRMYEIKPPPEFSTSRVVLKAIETSEKIHRKDIVVYIASNSPDDDVQNGHIRYIPTCPYCNASMAKKHHLKEGRKEVGKPDLRIKVITYMCNKKHLIHLHDCPVKGLLYWSPAGGWGERKKRKSKNRSAPPTREGSLT